MRPSSEVRPFTEMLDQLDSSNIQYVEEMMQSWSAAEEKVPADWAETFRGLTNGQPQLASAAPVASNGSEVAPAASAEASVDTPLVRREALALREFGFLAARLDPLGLTPAPAWEQIRDWQEPPAEQSSSESVACPTAAESAAIERLRAIYCGSVGYEFMHLHDPTERRLVAEWIEAEEASQGPSSAEREDVLRRLIEAREFEQYVRKKFIGAKTFSLEGCEALLPLLDRAMEQAAEQGVEEAVIGMAHRGRLNVLANLIGKPPREIFHEFEDGHPEEYVGRGDVKYHLGHSGERTTFRGHRVYLALCFNPSHLEFVSSVVLGRVRAKQDSSGDNERRHSLAVLIHGDSAFAGEGVVQETLNLARLMAYRTGGALHVIVNNQLGFTTTPCESRSTQFASDVARGLQLPIFHVNAGDPDAVVRVVDLAMKFRETFRRDVLIDLIGYRRWGHNEGDEPSFTQPLLYQAVEHHQPVDESYAEALLTAGHTTPDRIAAMQKRFRKWLRDEYKAREQVEPKATSRLTLPSGAWAGYIGGPEPINADESVDTSISLARVHDLMQGMSTPPETFHLHKKLQDSVASRRRMATGDELFDWSAAEALALASLAEDGYRIRLVGQDSIRGTFSQRHSVWYDQVDGHPRSIFANLPEGSAPVEIYNSSLSEAAAMGFEYGYSICTPQSLVLWEAQFGDFANAGQVVIDQFMAGAESKWNRLTGMVLLLPHGFEGQGPEHSSARLERFLGLSAQHNLQIIQPTTPAQYFHALRRQALQRWKKPLVVLTPKSLLRHPEVQSTREEFSSGRFLRVVPDPGRDPSHASRILMCSGKVFYDLDQYRRDNQRDDIAIVRVEQFYPLHNEHLEAVLMAYPEGTPATWVQEEPKNAGSWRYWRYRYGDLLLDRHPFDVVAREECASPATGSRAAHRREQQLLIEQAFGRV
jgi:2-oxoglutarate dehydrogenase E1 component